MLVGWLGLRAGELQRLAPFCGLYLLLFAALTLADGLSLTLFVQQIGAERLPWAYAGTAGIGMLAMVAYLAMAERLSSHRAFLLILGGTMTANVAAWMGIRFFDGGLAGCALLFVTREVSFTLVLMHFGVFLQEYFAREQLNRILPIVYAGGRVGGIVGGAALAQAAPTWPVVDLLWAAVGLAGLGVAVTVAITRRMAPVDDPQDHRCEVGTTRLGEDELAAWERHASRSALGFLRLVLRLPLLFWLTVASLAFVACRWVLNYQYSAVFEASFADDAQLAAFLGRYTQWALVGSLALQLFVVNRLRAWFGIAGVHLLYATLVVVAAVLNWLPMALTAAMFSRLVETELRFGLRNPAMQWLTNRFSKRLRTRVRAWSLGLLIPLGTGAAAVLLGTLAHRGGAAWIAAVGMALAVTFWTAAFKIHRTLRDAQQRPAAIAGSKTADDAIPTAKWTWLETHPNATQKAA